MNSQKKILRSTHARRVFPTPGVPKRADERGVAIAAGLDMGFNMVLSKILSICSRISSRPVNSCIGSSCPST